MRDPAFGKSMEVLIRGGAALASTQVKLHTFEEKQGDVTIFGYRFDEDAKFPADEQNLRFNFTPSFAVVKRHSLAASNLDLCKESVDILQKGIFWLVRFPEIPEPPSHAKGGGDFLNASPEALLTQTILSQAITEAEAKQQVERLLKFTQKLGSLRFETDYSAKDFRFDINWRFDKSTR